MIARLLLLLVLLLPGLAHAVELPRGLKPVGEGVVAAVDDGDTVTLKDGRVVRLVGIQAPKVHDARGRWPGWEASKRMLTDLTLGRHVTLHAAGSQSDRHGRVLAHLVLDDGNWVQGAMLQAGQARVYSFPDNRVPARAMLAVEAAARAAGKGIWADPFYAVRDAARFDGAGRAGYFELLRGRVTSAKATRGGLYLDFGSDWRTDFSVHIGGRALRSLPADFRVAEAWPGKEIEVRGWIFQRNGPMIEVSHPEQISGDMFKFKAKKDGKDGKRR